MARSRRALQPPAADAAKTARAAGLRSRYLDQPAPAKSAGDGLIRCAACMRRHFLPTIGALLVALAPVTQAMDIVVPTFVDEISCLARRVAVVKIVDRAPLHLDGAECGHVYWVEVVEAIDSPVERFWIYSNEDRFEPSDQDYLMVAFRWPHEVSVPVGCYDADGSEIPCPPPEPSELQMCVGRRADWSVTGSQRLFRIEQMSPSIGIEGRWVVPDRESILRDLFHVRTFRIFPPGGSGKVESAFSFDDLKRLILATPAESCS